MTATSIDFPKVQLQRMLSVIVYVECQRAQINTNSLPGQYDLRYLINDPLTNVTITPFTSSYPESICGAIKYQISPILPPCFTFTIPLIYETNSKQSAPILTLFTKDQKQYGNYLVVITGYQDNGNDTKYAQSSINFTISVDDRCMYQTFDQPPLSISTQVYGDQSNININLQQLPVYFSQLSLAPTISTTNPSKTNPQRMVIDCGLQSFVLKKQLDFASIMNDILVIFPNNTANIGQNTIEIDAFYPDHQNYPHLSFNQVPNCGAKIAYSLQNLDPNIAKFISLKNSSVTVNLTGVDLNDSFQQYYNITLQAQFIYPQNISSTVSQTQVIIEIDQCIFPSQKILKFSSPLLNQQVFQNSSVYYQIPDIVSQCTNAVSVEASVKNPAFQQVVNFDNKTNTFFINPTDLKLIGQQTIVQVTITDQLVNQSYSFVINVQNLSVNNTSIIQPIIQNKKTFNQVNKTYEQVNQTFLEFDTTSKTNLTNIKNEITNQTEQNAQSYSIGPEIIQQILRKPQQIVNQFQVLYPVPKFVTISQIGTISISFSRELDQRSVRRLQQNQNNFTDEKTQEYYKKSLSLSVFNKGSNYSNTNITFNWTVTNVTSQSLFIKLNFTKSLLISNEPNSGNDQLQIIFISPIFAAASTGVQIPAGFTLIQSLPPQMPDQILEQALGPATSSLSSSMNTLIVGNFILNLLMTASLNFLWGMINCLQLFTHLPLFNLNFPANANVLMAKLLSVCQFSFLPMEKINSNVFKFNFTSTDPLNDKFNEVGYGNMNMIENIGTMYIFMLLLPFQYLMKYIIQKLAMLNACKKLRKYLVKKDPDQSDTFVNNYQRLITEGFMEFLICSLIAIYDRKIETISDKVQKYFAYICLGLSVLLLISHIIFVAEKSKNAVKTHLKFQKQKMKKFLETPADLNDEENKLPQLENVDILKIEKRPKYLRDFEELQKEAEESLEKVEPYFGVFMDSLRIESKAAISYNLIFMVKIIVFVASVFFLQNYVAIQLLIFNMMSLLSVVYLISVKPFDTRFQNYLQLVNEISILLISYQTFLFNGFLPDPNSRYSIGWCTILNVLSTVLMNFIVILVSNLLIMKKNIKKRCYEYRIKQLAQKKQKQLTEQNVKQNENDSSSKIKYEQEESNSIEVEVKSFLEPKLLINQDKSRYKRSELQDLDKEDDFQSFRTNNSAQTINEVAINDLKQITLKSASFIIQETDEINRYNRDSTANLDSYETSRSNFDQNTQKTVRFSIPLSFDSQKLSQQGAMQEEMIEKTFKKSSFGKKISQSEQNEQNIQRNETEGIKIAIAVQNLLKHAAVVDVCEEINVEDSDHSIIESNISANVERLTSWSKVYSQSAQVNKSGVVFYDLEQGQ